MAKKSQKLPKTNSLNQQLVDYAEMAGSQRTAKQGPKNWVAFGAASAALAVGSAAEATVIHTDLGLGIPLGFGNTASVTLDTVGANGVFTLNLQGTFTTTTFGNGTAKIFGGTNNVGPNFYTNSSPIGPLVGGGAASQTIAKGGFTSASDNIETGLGNSATTNLGVSFAIGGNVHFGWIKVHVTRAGGMSGTVVPTLLTILEYAYEDVALAAIGAGHTTSLATDVPEPAFGRPGRPGSARSGRNRPAAHAQAPR